MGHCYLCGEDNGGGLGLCTSCKDEQTGRQAAAPLKPIEALNIGKVHSREQHTLLMGASLCLTIGIMLLYFVFSGGSPAKNTLGSPVTVTTPTDHQIAGIILDYIKANLTCGGSAPTALSTGVTRVLPYTPDATGWPVTVMIQYRCADNRIAPAPTYTTLYVQVSSNGTWQVVDPATLADESVPVGSSVTLKARYSADLNRLQIP